MRVVNDGEEFAKIYWTPRTYPECVSGKLSGAT
eukprot:SAG11_NODE_48687_length_122_cov_15.347826_1_plen_32_part_10